MMPITQENDLQPSTVSANLLLRFQSVRSATIEFCQPLSAEDMMVQSCPEASPLKWHLAHTSWFFETFVLREFLAGYRPFHPEFHWLFNSYYNSLGDMPEKKLRASFSRPPLEQIFGYREFVDKAIARLLAGSVESEAVRRIALGLEHEQQHLELAATDIKHALFTNPLHPAYAADATLAAEENAIAPPMTWVPFRPGLTSMGMTPDPDALDGFAFDNETPRHTVYVAPFALGSRLVTCAEYLRFVDDDGYRKPQLWLSEGWMTIREQGWEAPLYWRSNKDTRSGWEIFTMHGFEALDSLSEAPVCHLSFFEADAFARWSGCRLPTEAEWESATDSLTLIAREQNRKAELLVTASLRGELKPTVLPAVRANLMETGRLHPAPASAVPGVQQMFGDVWEWTSSPYTGYPGYRPLPGALGEYNGKFMSSQVILRGGSCVTPAAHIRPTYRNFFPPSMRWQMCGLRLAKDLSLETEHSPEGAA